MLSYFLQCPVCNYFLLPVKKECSNQHWRCTTDSCKKIFKMLHIGTLPASRTLVEGENPDSIGSNAFLPVLDIWQGEHCQVLISLSALTMLNEACKEGYIFAEYERDRIKALIRNDVTVICRLANFNDRRVIIRGEILTIDTQ